jgi:hypothetical protein
MIGKTKRLFEAAIGFNPAGWLRYAFEMRRYLRELKIAPPTEGQATPHFLVAVIPWLGTGIPWLSLATGRMLAASGAKVTFVLDDMRFDPKAARHHAVVMAVGHAMDGLHDEHRVIRLSELPRAEVEVDHALVERLAAANAVWELKGETIKQGRAEIERANAALLEKAYGPIAKALAEVCPDVVFAPGGVFGTSGLWARAARRGGVRFASFDNGGMGTWMVAADGLACHHGDIPRAVATLDTQLSRAGRAEAIRVAAGEIDARKKGTDTFAYQVAGSGTAGEELRGAVLIALNSSWDSAALGIHEAFSSNIEWIVETVRHLLREGTAPVIVRQHPAERFDFARTSDDYARVLQEEFDNHPRLRFIAAQDPVNSYTLMEKSRAVVVHSSTIGNEAASLGIPVVTPSKAYFSSLGFVNAAETREAYFTLLDAAANDRLNVSGRQREQAQLCYYATQVSNWVRSEFNPEQFKTWRKRPLSHWLAEPATRRMLDALLTNVPVAILNHQDRLREHNSQLDRETDASRPAGKNAALTQPDS